MRICIITKYLPPVSTEGIPRNRWEYALQFKALGHEVHVITSGRDACEKIVQGVYIHQIASWDKQVSSSFEQLHIAGNIHNQLSYSYLVYQRVRQLNQVIPFHVIDSPLWDIEGYITKLKLPEIPLVIRIETTSMLLKEVVSEVTPQKDLLNEIETHFLELADGYVLDSWSILKETERLYKIRFDKKPYAVIHHGIDLKGIQSFHSTTPTSNTVFTILSIGRLEKRKGSDILVKELIRLLLENVSDIQIHLAGKDSGEWDGFKEETGFTYHEYIERYFKEYLNKQLFIYGYVSDEKLDELYTGADLVFSLSKYESFGLLYLEAMRKGKPQIVFQTGAVEEIFEDGKDAIIIPLAEPQKVVDSVIRLKNDPSLCNEIGNNALQKLINRFSAESMAAACGTFFENVVYKPVRRIFQVMNCLTDRDGVSNITIDFDRLLKSQNSATQILGSSASSAVQYLLKPIESVQFKESDIIIYHYWNYCEKGAYFNSLTYPKKAFFFHNITTPDFFSVDDEAYHTTSKGYKQLGTFDNFDIYIGLTAYSLEILRQSIGRPITTHIIPPFIDSEHILSRPYNNELANSVRKKYSFHIIFVGVIAAHKKQIDLVNFFKYYSQQINPDSHLSIIGGGSQRYVNELTTLIKNLGMGNQVTVTGKISNEGLYAYYRSADIYLSMCEHEGFGIPLAEAMVFGIPVVAYNCTAVPDTVGDNGCLFNKKDVMLISETIEKLRKNEDWKNEVLFKQSRQLKNYSYDSVVNAFQELYELIYESHFERITAIKRNADLLLEEYIFYNDNRLKSTEPLQVIDNQLVLVNHLSGITIQEIFCDIEINFLSHGWSGNVCVQIDDRPVAIFDLFSTERKLKGIRLNEKPGMGMHIVRIWKAGQQNSFSKGNDVFLHSIRIMKPFGARDKNSNATSQRVTGITDDAELESELPTVEEEVNADEYVIGEHKILRLQEEVEALDKLYRYTPDWGVKDQYYKFIDGGQCSGTIEFDKEFMALTLYFNVHPWSGMVEINVDNRYKEIIDLYNLQNEQKGFRLKKIFKQQLHHVTIKALSKKNALSGGREMFFRGASFERHIAIEITAEELEANYKVSVVINTLDRVNHLENLIKALLQQTYPWFEIVVVNGPSKDRTVEMLAEYENCIKICSCGEANLSMSRNVGVENASGDFVAFIDDDALPCDECWIENFIYYIIWNKNLPVGAVGGPVKHKHTEHYEFKNGATSDYGFQIFREEELKDHQLDGRRWVQGVAGGNSMVAKKALYEIGGFDERFVYYLDETDMCIRLARKGYVVINNPINYIKHFKAPGNARKSAYDIRWDLIARSDVLFALKNGYDIFPVRVWKAIFFFKRKHFYREVIKAFKEQIISKEEFKKYRKLLKKGFYEGLNQGLFHKEQMHELKDKNLRFYNFKKKLYGRGNDQNHYPGRVEG